MPRIELFPRREHGVNAATPEGAYLHVADDRKRMQIVVVGSMRYAPVDYLESLRDELGSNDIFLVSVEHMPAVPEVSEDLRHVVMLRGFVSMTFERRVADDKPAETPPPSRPRLVS